MHLLNTNEIAQKWGISERRVRKMCENNLVDGATKISGFWQIPDNVSKPIDRRYKNSKRVVLMTSSLQAGMIFSNEFKKKGLKVTLISDKNADYGDVDFYHCNINDTQRLKEVFNTIDRIDSLIIFPSSYLPKTIDETTVSDFNYCSDLIVKNTYNTIKYAIKNIREHKGNIVLIHSTVSLNPEPGATIYSMLQATLIMLGKALAIREGQNGVRVNNIALGPAKTDSLMEQVTRTQINEWEKINPLGVTFKIEDCVELLFALSTGKGSYGKMTGTVIPIDGGESIADSYTVTQKGGM